VAKVTVSDLLSKAVRAFYRYLALEELNTGRIITELYISYNGYSSNTSANDIYSSLAVWLISSPTSQTIKHRVSEIQRQITILNAYKLPPGYYSSALVTLSVLEYSTDKWVTYNIGM
jgi:hypothetical protein